MLSEQPFSCSFVKYTQNMVIDMVILNASGAGPDGRSTSKVRGRREIAIVSSTRSWYNRTSSSDLETWFWLLTNGMPLICTTKSPVMNG